ncbi:MAG: response regulator [Desulfobacteraceae bacterium]|nr:response regulator [Desulfobacteraceae bacterium]
MALPETEKKISILLVDDEESIRRVLSLTLFDDGYDVATAGDGQEALRIFRQSLPDIVISDIKMPGMSGIELLEQIKAEHPETEVIMITGHGDLQTAIESLKKDATDFITKPLQDETLQIAIGRARERIAMRRRMADYTHTLEQQVAEKIAHLESSRRRSQQLFDESPCYITVQDANLRMTEANQRFMADFDGHIGMHCFQAYKKRSQPCPDCPVMTTFTDGQPHQSEMQVTAKDGTLRHLFIATAPITENNGPIRHVIEMSTDITELRYLQNRLASLGLHAGSVSHAIKGLLTNLDAGVYLLNTGRRKGDDQRLTEGLEMINQSAGRIRRMILDVLFYAKERGLEFQIVDALELAREVCAQFSARLQNQAVTLECRLDPGAPAFSMDPVAMRTALANILDNALDACLERGDGNGLKITFGLQAKSDYLIFDIIDNGVGMDKAAVENLFDLFFSSKGGRGTGLGLFVAHQIITRHGGTIHVSSEKNQGSHFRIVLPVIG